MYVSKPNFHPIVYELILKYHFIGKIRAILADFWTLLPVAKLFDCRVIL